jgi:hypothetical protein
MPDAPPDSRFLPAKEKLKLGSLDDPSLTVLAQYNPRELVVTQPISWTEHAPLASQKPDAMYLDFTGMQPQTIQIELLFDGAENGGWTGDETTVVDSLTTLRKLASVREPYASNEELRRPHFCAISWGPDIPRFEGVIDSLVVKYQMWDRDGNVLRASATVSMKQASRVGLAEKARPKNRVRPT